MYGDTTAIRHLARQLRDRADDIEAEAARLAHRVDAAPWSGLAADAMRAQARVRLAGLSRAARLHEEAAEALARHAGAVDHAVAMLEAAARAVQSAADSASGLAGDAANGVLDSIGRLPGLLR